MDKLKALFQSRKFWVLVASLVAIGTGYFAGGIDVWQSVQALVAAFAVYSTGVAIEDGLSRRG